MTVTFVSSFYNIYYKPCEEEKAKAEFQSSIPYFLHLVKLRLHIVLFTTEPFATLLKQALQEQQLDKMAQLHIILQDIVFPTQGTTTLLPNKLNPIKDTPAYLHLMNLKTHFLKWAIELDKWPQDSHFAWIDFRITKIFKQLAPTLGFLQYLGNAATLYIPHLVISGCWRHMDHYNIQPWGLVDFFDRVYWRFCGGFYIGDRAAHLQFHHLYEIHYPEFSKTNLTWEVNFWAWLEQENHFTPLWYESDHNDSILTKFPHCCFTASIASKCSMYPINAFLQKACPAAFHPSNVSYWVDGDQEWLNVRIVNYHIDENHCYHIKGNKIMTLNLLCKWPLVTPPRLVTTLDWNENQKRCDDPVAYGIEDLRVWHDETGQVRCLATNWDHTPNNVSQIVQGRYDVSNAIISDIEFVIGSLGEGEEQVRWEKNWAPLEHTSEFIYKWSVDSVYTGVLCTEGPVVKQVPMTQPNSLFREMRGSSVFYPLRENASIYIGVIHSSEIWHGKKIYYHMLVQISRQGRLLKHTDPFYFIQKQIEFCIGYRWQETSRRHHFWVSQVDCNLVSIETCDSTFNWHTLPDDVVNYTQSYPD